MTDTDEDTLRARLARACRVLGRLDLTRAATGHISARVPGTDRILIRARGPEELGVRYTGEDQILEMDLDGNVAADEAEGLKAPLEAPIHTELYRARPDIGAVVHMHPPHVVACTIADVPLEPIYGAYDPRSAQLAMNGIPTYPRSILIDNPALGQDLAEAMGDAPVCLMRGHGVTTTAGTIEDAALLLINVNELADMTIKARSLGKAEPIPAEDQAAIAAIEPPGKKDLPAGELSPRSKSLWRYYCTLTDA